MRWAGRVYGTQKGDPGDRVRAVSGAEVSPKFRGSLAVSRSH